jgi:hypothetical protein
MKLVLLLCCSFFFIYNSYAQDISIRVQQVSFSSEDPDGAGPAKGSVMFKIELKSSSTDVLADGFGLSVAYQSGQLLATPANTVTKLGPINTAHWKQQVDNRQGNTITPVTYGGRSFDKRMIITFNQEAGVPDAVISSTTWTEVAQLTYYTIGEGYPQGGFIVPEPAVEMAQNELSSDGGLTTYPYLSPGAGSPLALGASVSQPPVRFVQFDALCSPSGTNLTWSTDLEKDTRYFEVQKSTDGTSWSSIGRVNGTGSSNSLQTYQYTDLLGGAAQYRIRHEDMNGAETYSDPVRTTCNSTSFYVKLYPVPARDQLTLVINSEKEVKTNVYVVNINGMVVMNVPLTINKGLNNFTLIVSHLSQGQYYLQSDKDGVKINHRFIIAR